MSVRGVWLERGAAGGRVLLPLHHARGLLCRRLRLVLRVRISNAHPGQVQPGGEPSESVRDFLESDFVYCT